jgi:hypothetical protein
MNASRLQPMMAWAEDRALLGSTPSADPGVGAEDRAGHNHLGSVLLQNNTFSFNTNAKNPTRNRSATRTRSFSQITNAIGPKFQFTVNQDRMTSLADSPVAWQTRVRGRPDGGDFPIR